MPPSTRSIKIILFKECGVYLAIPFCISLSSVVPSGRLGYFLEFSVNFRLIASQILIGANLFRFYP